MRTMRDLRKDARIVLIVLIAALVISQAFRINKTNPPVQSDIAVAPEMNMLLHRACYNCHSDETVWPWYSNIAPISWLVGSDVSEGRELLNFSEWGKYNPELKSKKLKKIGEEVGNGGMPPWYYTFVHSEARLTPTEREQFQSWAAAELTRAGHK